MISKEMKFIAEGIKLIIRMEVFSCKEKDEWLNKYDEVFPKPVPFGGAYDKEDDTS